MNREADDNQLPPGPPPSRRRNVPVTAILVTHNSERVIQQAVDSLCAGTDVPHRIVIVDSGSSDPSYLADVRFGESDGRIVRPGTNVGFCLGNNLGLRLADEADDILLVNPDAFVLPDFLRRSRQHLADDPSVGALGPKLQGFDIEEGKPNGLIDSAGICQTFWGRFYDRGQREPDHGQYDRSQDVVALCGATILLRRSALDAVLVDGGIFDASFFMYKEDVDLAIRLQRAGWRTVYFPEASVLHCRGWKPNRRSMPRWARQRSLQNEWRLWLRGWTPSQPRWRALPYLTVKTIAVFCGV